MTHTAARRSLAVDSQNSLKARPRPLRLHATFSRQIPPRLRAGFVRREFPLASAEERGSGGVVPPPLLQRAAGTAGERLPRGLADRRGRREL